jgi:hypothetical protein
MVTAVVHELEVHYHAVTPDVFADEHAVVATDRRDAVIADTLAAIEALEAEGLTLDVLEECPRERQPHLAYTHVRMTTEGRVVEWHSHAYPAREVAS